MKSTRAQGPWSSRNVDYDKDKDLIAIYNYPAQVRRAIQEIQGVAGMIVYDGEVSDAELSFLDQWLKKNEPLATSYPVKELKALFAEVARDGVVTPAERRKLFGFLGNISSGTRSNPVIDGIFASNPRIQFKERIFLFTGEMEFGPREKAETAVVEREGIVAASCTLKTNFLVVGNLGSEAYKYSRFGTKIEKAITYQKEKKSRIQIVRERDFVAAVMRA